MKALHLTLTLETPVLLSSISKGDENSSRSMLYIPGGALRGTLAARYIRQNGVTDLTEDPEGSRLFLGSKVYFLNAYAAADNQGKVRSLPVPASWRKRKGAILKNAVACDLALAEPDRDFDERPEKGFCNPDPDENSFILLSPLEELAVHISGQARGTVFQYQALGSEQTFLAAILAEDSKDLEALETLIKSEPILYLGRSRSAHYGRVRVQVETSEGWQEAGTSPQGDVTIITLLSDTILRDQNGQPTHDLDGYLARLLGKTGLQSRRFIKTTWAAGFNRRWGMPLPQLPALGMGSVFVYPAKDLSAEEMRSCVEKGIGERRIDGFGRIAVNWPGEETVFLNELEPAKPQPFNQLSSKSKELAQAMSRRILRQRLDEFITEKALKYSIRGNINNHQLSRLRNVLCATINQGKFDPQAGITFLKNLKMAREQYRRSRVITGNASTGPRLLTWLDDRFVQKDGLEDFWKGNLPDVAGQAAELDDAIKTEYTLRLVEAIIDGKMKKNREVSQ